MSDEEALKRLRKEVFKDSDLPGSSAIWKLTLSRTHLQLPLQKLARNQLLCFRETVLLCVCAFASLFLVSLAQVTALSDSVLRTRSSSASWKQSNYSGSAAFGKISHGENQRLL